MNLERYSEFNDPGTILNVDEFSITTNIKIIFQNLFFNAFLDRNSDIKERSLSIREFLIKDYFEAKPRDKDPIFIHREFPFESRKYPLILIETADTKEEKPYLGWDNIVETNVIDLPNGIRIGQIMETQHYTGKLNVRVAARGIDIRDTLCDFVASTMQNFYRSNYVFSHPDGRSFYVIHIGAQPVEKTLDRSPVTDGIGGEQFPIFTGYVSNHFKVEHYYIKESYDYIFKFRKNLSGTVSIA
jgi:hypothetical protein